MAIQSRFFDFARFTADFSTFSPLLPRPGTLSEFECPTAHLPALRLLPKSALAAR